MLVGYSDLLEGALSGNSDSCISKCTYSGGGAGKEPAGTEYDLVAIGKRSSEK